MYLTTARILESSRSLFRYSKFLDLCKPSLAKHMSDSTESYHVTKDKKMIPAKEPPGYYPPKVPYKNKPNHIGEVVNLTLNDMKPGKELKSTWKVKNSKHKMNVEENQEENDGFSDSEELSEFVKLGKNDKILSNALMRVKSRKHREKNKEILLEGKRLIQDALDAGVKPLSIFVSRTSLLKDLILCNDVKLYKCFYKDIQLWSDVSTSQGIIGIFEEPVVHDIRPDGNSIPLTIICDNVRDPGNMGTILRTAASVGCRQVILTKGCVDVWEPKVLRSGAGSHFRVPLVKSVSWENIMSFIDDKSVIYLADNKTSEETTVPDEEEDIDADTYELDSEGKKITENKRRPKKTIQFQKKSDIVELIPLVQYDSVSYSKDESIVLVIGGETEGLSSSSFELTQHHERYRVHIPLCSNVESLNCGTALAVISFEIRRQFKLREKFNFDQESVYTVNRIPGIYTE